MTLSVVIIAYNEESNIGRTLESVMPLVHDGKGEIVVVDSGSTDRTVEIAKSFGAKVFVEGWKGYAAQKNSAIDKATGDWILSLDADEEVESALADEIQRTLSPLDRKPEWCVTIEQQTRASQNLELRKGEQVGLWISRQNYFLGRWVKHGGFWPDRKLRLFRKGAARFEENRLVHEDARLIEGVTGNLRHSIVHHSYPTLSDYIDHMNRYSSLGAEMVAHPVAQNATRVGHPRFSFINIVLRPMATFVYNYFFRLGFLDGREGLLLHMYHAVYVSWKYAKAWEVGRKSRTADPSLRSG